MKLTEFLLARIAEDEAAAMDSLERGFGDWEWLADLGVNYEARTHMVRHHPARVLAECEAKRRIVDAARADYEDSLQSGDDTTSLAEEVLRVLALPYSDHPDYDEAWRP